MDKFEIVIASPPDRERLVAEIYYENQFWAEISQEIEKGPYMIQFYAPSNHRYWEFSYENALNILNKAKTRLGDLDSPRENIC